VVIALAGRRIDAPGVVTPRFPLGNVDIVRDRIRILLEELRPKTLVCSAGCGADLLALEVSAELGLRRRVVLPFPVDRFLLTSVADRPGDWAGRYSAAMSAVEAMGDLLVLGQDESDAEAYARVNRVILEEAWMAAAAMQDEIRAVAVWDGRSHSQLDMTLNFVHAALQKGVKISEIFTL